MYKTIRKTRFAARGERQKDRSFSVGFIICIDPREHDRLERAELRGKIDMATEWHKREVAAAKELGRLFGLKVELGSAVVAGDLCSDAGFKRWVPDLQKVADLIEQYGEMDDNGYWVIPLEDEMFAMNFTASRGHEGHPDIGYANVKYEDWDEVFFH